MTAPHDPPPRAAGPVTDEAREDYLRRRVAEPAKSTRCVTGDEWNIDQALQAQLEGRAVSPSFVAVARRCLETLGDVEWRLRRERDALLAAARAAHAPDVSGAYAAVEIPPFGVVDVPCACSRCAGTGREPATPNAPADAGRAGLDDAHVLLGRAVLERDEARADAARLREDAVTVADFIVGWWPGLEDGLSWPSDADDAGANPVFAAAKRIVNAARAERPAE